VAPDQEEPLGKEAEMPGFIGSVKGLRIAATAVGAIVVAAIGASQVTPATADSGPPAPHEANGYVLCSAGVGINVSPPTIFAFVDPTDFVYQATVYRAHLYKWTGSQWQWIDASPWIPGWGSHILFPASFMYAVWIDTTSQFPDYGSGYYKVAYEFAWYDKPISGVLFRMYGQAALTHNTVTKYDFLWKNDDYTLPIPPSSTFLFDGTTGAGISTTTTVGDCYMSQ
jgi:hypothetical protein